MIEKTIQTAGFADVAGTKLFYKTAGQGHPLVLLHAGIADSRMWDAQLNQFSQAHQVIAYDLRGFGRTEMAFGPFSHHRDLYELLNFLKIPKTYLLGVSQGGAVAIDFTLEHPELVDALILVASALGGYQFTDGATIEAWTAIEAALERGDHEGAAELETQMWVAGPQRSLDQIDPAVRALVRDMLLPTYGIPPDQAEEQTLEPAAIFRLEEIDVPTLVLVGDRDVPDMLNIAEVLASGISAAEKVIMSGVAHLPNLEKPAEFNRIVLDFLSELNSKR